MHKAADNGDTQILKLLIQKKGDPNKQDYMQGRTPMHYATEKGHIECLKLLIDAGGRYDIKDDLGKDCLDLCTPASRKMLEKLKIRDLMLPKDNQTDSIIRESPIIQTDKSPDQYSLYSGVDSDTTSRRSSVSSIQEKQPVIGYLYMSVEYHSSKQTLKIRVWQLTDILLPPPHTSGIHSIYVKSFLLPDKKKETKRKTEDIRVDTSEAHVKWKDKSSVQHVFMPSSFKFKRALEYNKVDLDMVKERNLQIEVCITQRYSHRSFLIGMLTMSLRKAVKKVVREKIALIPCMNHTIPANMKVYCASELDITSNKVFYSTPNVKVNIPDLISDDNSEKAASIPDLKEIKYSPSIEVDMNNVNRSIPHVPKLNLDDATLDESGYSSEFHVSMPGDLESPDSDKAGVKLSRVSKYVLTSVDEDSTERVLESVKEKLTKKTRAVTKIENGIEITDLDEEEPVSITVDSEDRKETSVAIKPDEHESSRPETPTWDYYDVPTDIVTMDTEITSSPWEEGAAPVVLPMETNLGIHQIKDGSGVKQTESEVKSKDKVKKKSKKRSTPAVPGRAMPLVPEIIVVNTDNNNSKTKLGHATETHVDIPGSAKHGLPKIVVESSEQIDEKLGHVVDMNTGNGNANGSGSRIVKDSVNMETVKVVRSPKGKGKSANSEDTQSDSNTISGSTAGKGKINKDIGEARAICVIEPVEQVVERLDSVDNFVNIVNRAKIVDVENNKQSQQSLPIVKPRTKKLRKVREGGSKAEIGDKSRKVNQSENVARVIESTNKSNIQENIYKPKTSKSKDTADPILNEIKVIKPEQDSVKTKRSDPRSYVIDMDKLSFSTSDAHIVELDDDISITELSADSQLFSHSSVLSDVSSMSIDMEGGLEESSYKLPECVSPTKYMIPMQVYMDEDTSCDESLPTDRSDRSITTTDRSDCSITRQSLHKNTSDT